MVDENGRRGAGFQELFAPNKEPTQAASPGHFFTFSLFLPTTMVIDAHTNVSSFQTSKSSNPSLLDISTRSAASVLSVHNA